MITHQCEIDVVSRIPERVLGVRVSRMLYGIFCNTRYVGKIVKGLFDLNSYIYVPNLEREIGRFNFGYGITIEF
jgi:hypothetical protein